MEILIENNIMAIIPIYEKDLGNVTRVYFENHQPVTIEKSMKTVFSYLLRYYMINIDELRSRYKGLLGGKNLMPIPFSKDDILIPVKIRTPLTKNDGAFGYINLRYLEKIRPKDGYIEVSLSNEIINICSSMETLEKHIQRGNIIKNCYVERRFYKAINYDKIILDTREQLLHLREELLNISKDIILNDKE